MTPCEEELARVILDAMMGHPRSPAGEVAATREAASAVIAKLAEDRSDQVIQDAAAAIERCPEDSSSIVLAMAALGAAGPSTKLEEAEAKVERLERELERHIHLRRAQSAAARFMEAATYGDGFPGGIEATVDVLKRALDDDTGTTAPRRPQPPDRF